MTPDKYFYTELTKTASIPDEEVIAFFVKNPSPSDKEFHRWATQRGFNEHKAEEVVYRLLGSFVGAGKSKGKKLDIPQKLIDKGIEVELEHTSNRLLAEKVVRDHYFEFPPVEGERDYYDFLMDAETLMKKKS